MTDQTQPAFPIIDLHSHLVPGVDDGTRTVAESLESLAVSTGRAFDPLSPHPTCSFPT